MTQYKFNKEYNVILFTLYALLDRFEKEDRLFAVHYIWQLGSKIQFTVILIYYRHYKVSPSDYS